MVEIIRHPTGAPTSSRWSDSVIIPTLNEVGHIFLQKGQIHKSHTESVMVKFNVMIVHNNINLNNHNMCNKANDYLCVSLLGLY